MHQAYGNCTWPEENREDIGAKDATIECAHPFLQLHGVETADLGLPVTLKALEEGLAGFTGLM